MDITNSICVYNIIPPRGYVAVGQFITSHTGDPVKNFVYPPMELLFLRKSEQFVQPIQPGGTWTGISRSPKYYNLVTTKKFNTTVSQLQPSGKTILVPLSFSGLGNLLFNGAGLSPTSTTNYNFDTYPNTFPWSVNLQLVRYFPNSPNNQTQSFQIQKNNRLMYSGGGTRQDHFDFTPYSWLVNPNYSMCFFYPYKNSGDTLKYNAYYPQDQPIVEQSAKTVPLYIPFGLTQMLNGCIGTYISQDLEWDWSSFQPFPDKITPEMKNIGTSEIICLISGYSYLYNTRNSGKDCESITEAFCNENFDYFPTSTNCICLNPQKMLDITGLNEAPLDVQQFYSAYIACVYGPCKVNPYAFKSVFQSPYSEVGDCTSNFTYCIIQGNQFYGDNPTLINSCTGNGNPPAIPMVLIQ